jgi:hypothetical protein
LGDALEAREFLDVVSLDIVGPLPVTEQGNKYLLTVIDHFTRFCDAIPIAKQCNIGPHEFRYGHRL